MAKLAVEMHMSPDDVLSMDERMFAAVLQVFEDRARERDNASKANRPRRR